MHDFGHVILSRGCQHLPSRRRRATTRVMCLGCGNVLALASISSHCYDTPGHYEKVQLRIILTRVHAELVRLVNSKFDLAHHTN